MRRASGRAHRIEEQETNKIEHSNDEEEEEEGEVRGLTRTDSRGERVLHYGVSIRL